MSAPSDLPASLQASLATSKAGYKRLGKSGLRVSVPIFGTMSIGFSSWQDWVIDEDKSLPLLKAAYDNGINTWDTADIYSNGVSEEIIGKAIKKYNIPRHKLLILTKCYGVVNEEENVNTFMHREEYGQSKDWVNQFGLSRQAIFAAVNASLRRLDTDYIDLLQIHRFDYEVPIEETMEALHDLVKSGKVRYIGASSMWTYQFATMQFCAEKHGWTKFISMQNQYSLLYREEEREMNKFCNETGVGLIPWGPLEKGFLARPLATAKEGTTIRSAILHKRGILSEVEFKTIERVEELAKKKGWKMSHVALAWINKRISSPIIGFSSIERIEEALEANGKTLTDEEEKYLEELYQPRPVTGHA
ncbi:hypothetical protein AJ80_04194 [Polytolypa hystricis UAMH7299]|uniref:NADP-dependent oxidoreductase domain-containing protein n=1 Tax=Polytolypa hystricis (strain UAMH7299) TaxID=1447883 RepID=A0A2B7YC54_POLH7|nr:hypothetical protein AJ80_04194 [Polytolypa hystricis UAMH7299]